MFSYQGSKRKELKQISAYQPEDFDKFIDVFGGGGNVFLHYLKQGIYSVYNDKNGTIVGVVRTIADGKESAKLLMIEATRLIPSSNESRNELLNNHKKQPTPASFLALSCSSKLGMIYASCLNMKRDKKTGELTVESRKVSDITKYCHLLQEQKHAITNEDYKAVFAKYQHDDKAFLYCDPPYISRATNNQGYGECDEEYVETIDKFIRDPKTKCKIMLHVDFTCPNFILFKDLVKYYYPVNYNAAVKKKKLKKDARYHLIITNYNVNTANTP